MILNEEKKNVTVSGNFTKTDFSIHADPKAFSILSDKIYTNKVAAVIREISTNAYDAHVAAGNDEPFDVHLPTALEPFFSVRDYGTGLSHEDCMHVYTTYFMSTKTNSNDFVGALGLGSKSPFCMVDSFTVTSYFNGMVRTYSAYKDEEDCPQFALLTEDKTNERNGLEVSLSVDRDDIWDFEKEAKGIYGYFDTVPNINIKSVAEGAHDYLDKYTIRNKDYATDTGWGRIKCVMGQVCYNLDYDDVDHELSSLDAILYFNIGEINFTPGRETLSLDKKTIKAITAKLDFVQEDIQEQIQKQIDSCPNYFEAAKIWSSVDHKFHKGGMKYKDETIGARKIEPSICFYKERHRETVQKTLITSAYYDSKTEYFFTAPSMIGRIRAYLKDFEYAQNRRVVLIDKCQIEEIGFDASYVRELSELPKPERSVSSGTVDKCKIYKLKNKTYQYKVRDYWSSTEIDINDGVERVYVEISHFKVKNSGRWTRDPSTLNHTLRGLKQYIGDVEVYGVKSALLKTKSFKKSGFIHIDEFIKREMEDLVPTDDVSVFNCDERIASHLKKLEPLVNIEIISDFIESYNNQSDESLIKILRNLDFEIVESDTINENFNKIVKKFPLLSYLHSHWNEETLNEVAMYINCKQNQISENSEESA